MLMIDSANLIDIFWLAQTGLFRAVTTNPTVLAREGLKHSDIPELHKALQQLHLELEFYQTSGVKYDEILQSGMRIYEMNDGARPVRQNGCGVRSKARAFRRNCEWRAAPAEVIVKVPASLDGYRAANQLQKRGAKVLLTAVYEPSQALAAKALGAWGIAPYAGRIEDKMMDPVSEIGKMVTILRNSPTKVLAASLRKPELIGELAAVGVDHFTATPQVWTSVLDNPSTLDALQGFAKHDH